MSALLELQGVTAFYGQSQALFGVDLAVEDGEAVALMGRNGMGKTTTVSTIMHMLRHAGGTIRFAGQDLGTQPSHRVARAGIGLVPEGRRCFAPLTVEENLLSAARSGEWDIAAVTRLFPRLGERLVAESGTSVGR
jgi:branched-chain amino acid transport system ATP-binding protein